VITEIKEERVALLCLIKMNKKAFELPGWAYVIGLIIALFVLLFVIWLSTKSGYSMVDNLRGITG